MSLINLKKLLASVMLVLLLTSEVFATQGFRPWAPYQRDQFGGGARRTEGVYGTLEGVFYTFAPVKNIVIGDTEYTGGIRQAYTGSAIISQINTINTSNLGVNSAVGIRAEVGNNRGHHGWAISGYNVAGMNASTEMSNVSMVINDATRIPAFSTIGADFNLDSAYNGKLEFNKYPNGQLISNSEGPRALWGWFISEEVIGGGWEKLPTYHYIYDGNGNLLETVVEWNWEQIPITNTWQGELAPLPINFEKVRVTTKIDHWVIDAVYTYRFHPCRFGNLDAFGGVRYMQLDDSLLFLGDTFDQTNGLVTPWKGVTASEDLATGEITLAGSVFGLNSVLAGSDWRFKAENHIIAPQIGGRWSRTNNRWTLSTEGRFIAGFNQQNLRSQGSIGNYYNNLNQDIFTGASGAASLNYIARETYPWTPIGLVNSGRSFNHSKTHHAFSPGVEVKVNANWQLTNAVGINFGVTGMWVDEVARGSKINDYTLHGDGQFFGLKDKGFTDSALMYGVNFGLTVNRH